MPPFASGDKAGVPPDGLSVDAFSAIEPPGGPREVAVPMTMKRVLPTGLVLFAVCCGPGPLFAAPAEPESCSVSVRPDRPIARINLNVCRPGR